MHKSLFLILLLSLSLPAAARMYQWVDPESGTTQLSGKPPTWYRSETGGPRVVVFENGRVMDDTGIEVSESERQRLRQQALINAEQDRGQAREKLLEAKRMKALADKERQEREGEEAPRPDRAEISPEPEPEEKSTAEQQAEQTAEAMRELIREWERVRTEDAREVIGSGGESGEPAPPPREDLPPPPPPQ